MQEINLLQNKVKDRTLQFERSNRLVLVLFTFIIILEIAAFAGLYLLANTTNNQADKIAAENQEIQKSMDSSEKDLALAKGLQAQLKNVTSLVQNRIYWSAFLDQLGGVTPTNVQFLTMNGAISDNVIHLEGIGRTYADVGRLLLSLSTSDKFDNVKLHAVTPADTDTTFGYQFSLDVTVAGSAFKKQQQ